MLNVLLNRSLKIATTSVLVGGLAFSSVLGLFSPAEAYTKPGYKGRIVFQFSGDEYDVYTMESNGDNRENVTNTLGADYNPRWSPDGSHILFTSTRDGNQEVYVMNADGSGQTRLTNSPGQDGGPTWSPDGTKIAFYSSRDGGDREVYTMDTDGGNQTRLTNSAGWDAFPNWSPDGTRILFESNRDGYYDICAMNADGSSPSRLTFTEEFDEVYPKWSPVEAIYLSMT